MFPLFLLLALGAVAFAASQKGGTPGVSSNDVGADLTRLQAADPAGYAAAVKLLQGGASAQALLTAAAQYDAAGYHSLGKKLREMATAASGATTSDPNAVVQAAMSSGSPDVMRGAAKDLRAAGYGDAATALEAAAQKIAPLTPGQVPQVAQTLEPSMSPELQAQLNNALATVADPQKLMAMAALFDNQGYKTAARVLREKATAILIQSEATQAVRATDAVVSDQGLTPNQSPGAATNPTTAATTATAASQVVNQVASTMAHPTADAVKATAQSALQLAQSAPVPTDYTVVSGDSPWKIAVKFTGSGNNWPALIKANPQKPVDASGNFKSLWAGEVIHIPPAWASNPQASALLQATHAMLQSPNPGTLAGVAQAAAGVAAGQATPDTAGMAQNAVSAAQVLSQNPTAAQASRTAAVTASAANAAISSAGVPLPTQGKSTYVVQKGDSAWKIAQAITGNGARYTELIKANVPPKTVAPVAGGGENFTTLSAGEVLKLPASWVLAAPKSTIVADLPPPPGSSGTATPDWVMDLTRMQAQNPNLYASTMAVKNGNDAAAMLKAADILISNPSVPSAYYPALSAAFRIWASQAQSYGTTQPIVTPVSAQAPAPPGAPQTYTVLSGDSPWKIAQKIVGDGSRWRELVRANPQKTVDPTTGSFKYLNAGEVLNLPSTWTAQAPVISSGYRPPRPARTLAAMGYYPFATA